MREFDCTAVTEGPKHHFFGHYDRTGWASHSGARAVEHDEDDNSVKWEHPVTDEYLEGLIEASESADEGRREGARLHWQPSRYACSVPELDMIVDMARRMPECWVHR